MRYNYFFPNAESVVLEMDKNMLCRSSVSFHSMAHLYNCSVNI